MNKEEVDKFCKEYYGFTLEDADGSIGYWMGKYQELEQENNQLKNTKLALNGALKIEHEKFIYYSNVLKELRSWLEEQEKRAWDEVSSTFGYVLDKLNELEGGKND